MTNEQHILTNELPKLSLIITRQVGEGSLEIERVHLESSGVSMRECSEGLDILLRAKKKIGRTRE